MALAIHTISDSNINAVLEDPPLVWRVIAPDEPEMYASALEQKASGFFARLFGKKVEPKPINVPDLDFIDGEAEESDVDKAWHGIHYLLTGSAWDGPKPLDFLLNGGRTVGDVDVGYGPARTFDAGAVSEICEALSKVDGDALRTRFNPVEMMNLEIYPEIWGRDPNDDDTLEYCVENFERLKSFLNDARSKQLGVVLYVC